MRLSPGPKWPFPRNDPQTPFVFRAYCPVDHCGYDSDVYADPVEAEKDLAAHLPSHAKDRVRVIAK